MENKYIDKLFHFYKTTKSFKEHLEAGLINPDSICFLKESEQVYTQGFFIGVEKARYDAIEAHIKNIDKVLEDIPDVEELATIKRDLHELQSILNGYTEGDNLKLIIDTLNSKISSVESSLNNNVLNKLGTANGIATLDAEGKLISAQLPSFKSVNGESVVGKGDIKIDLTLYKIVQSLPTTDIDPNKIYLVLSDQSVESNIYTEYVYTDGVWEELGTYKAEVALTTCIKYDEIGPYISDINTVTSPETLTLVSKVNSFSSEGKPSTQDKELPLPAATSQTAGIMKAEDKEKIDNVEERATRDEAISIEELDNILI